MMNDFIGEYYLKDLSICDDLVQYFESSDRKKPGMMSYKTIDKSLKDSTDISVHLSEINQKEHSVVLNYCNLLLKSLDEYVKEYPECNDYSPFAITESLNLKRYKPGQGYKCWHCERPSAHPITVSRHLVFMTYLNDVTDHGGTEFKLQEKIVAAKKGKTLIWPADWTHTHRGIVSSTQTKYIISGWFNYT
jgi:hypothetical protein